MLKWQHSIRTLSYFEYLQFLSTNEYTSSTIILIMFRNTTLYTFHATITSTTNQSVIFQTECMCINVHIHPDLRLHFGNAEVIQHRAIGSDPLRTPAAVHGFHAITINLRIAHTPRSTQHSHTFNICT